MSGIFARPNLEDNFFKQLKGTVLTLSGETRIATTSGLTLTDNNNHYIPIILTGGSTGYNLTYINDEIVLRPVGTGTNPLYDSSRITTRSGIPEVCVGGCTISAFLDGYFFPSVAPSSSLSVLTNDTIRQFGDCSIGELSWSVTKHTNLICKIGIDSGATGNYCNILYLTGGSQSGTIGYVFPFACATPSSGVTGTTVIFSLSAKTTSGETTFSNANIIWNNNNFYFSNSTLYTDSAINTVLTGQTGILSNNKTLSTIMTFNNEFFYYAYPKVYGIPSFTVNGLPNNGWGNLNGGTLFTVTFTNTNGYSNQYYIARSDNRISGTYIISAI
jgi:hypothetical protein